MYQPSKREFILGTIAVIVLVAAAYVNKNTIVTVASKAKASTATPSTKASESVRRPANRADNVQATNRDGHMAQLMNIEASADPGAAPTYSVIDFIKSAAIPKEPETTAKNNKADHASGENKIMGGAQLDAPAEEMKEAPPSDLQKLAGADRKTQEKLDESRRLLQAVSLVCSKNNLFPFAEHEVITAVRRRFYSLSPTYLAEHAAELEKELRGLSCMYPENLAIAQMLGICMFSQKRYHEAVEYFSFIEKQAPSLKQYFDTVLLNVLAKRRGSSESVRATLDLAFSIYPNKTAKFVAEHEEIRSIAPAHILSHFHP